MNQNFFATMAPLLSTMNLTFTIAQKDEVIIISLLPQPKIKDAAKENIQPMIIKGTVEELDDQFFEAIKKPMAKVTGIVLEISEFEKGADKLAKENKAASSLKDKEKKEKDKLDKVILAAEEFLKKEEFDSCQKELDKATKIKEGYPPIAVLAKRLHEAKAKDDQVDMFDVISEEKPSGDSESPHELQNAGKMIQHGISQEREEAIRAEQDQKWSLNQKSN